MTRDDDLLRDLLFRLEADTDFESIDFVLTDGSCDTERKEAGHVELLKDAGLVADSGFGGAIRITNHGHDFLAAIREQSTWNKTKELAESAGVKTLGVLFEVAVSLGKQKLKEKMGLELG